MKSSEIESELRRMANQILHRPSAGHTLFMEAADLIRDGEILRRLLWLNHGCPVGSLYGDDGEMQCSKCRIDFLRTPPQEILELWTSAAIRSLGEKSAPRG